MGSCIIKGSRGQEERIPLGLLVLKACNTEALAQLLGGLIMEWTCRSVSPSHLVLFRGWPTCTLIFTLILLLISCEIPPSESAPASPWNQPGLNLIFKPDFSRLKSNREKEAATAAAVKTGDVTSKPSSTSATSSTSVSSTDSSSTMKKRLRKFPSHSWGYTRYGQDIGHIRHIASRNNKQNLPSNLSVPCPRDYVKLFNGKCRRIPKFSSSRVG